MLLNSFDIFTTPRGRPEADCNKRASVFSSRRLCCTCESSKKGAAFLSYLPNIIIFCNLRELRESVSRP